MFRVFLILCVGLCVSIVIAAEPWPQFGGPQGNFTAKLTTTPNDSPEWQRPLGQGTSGVVSEGKRLYTMFSQPQPDDVKTTREYACALDLATGKTIWEEFTLIERKPKQETFGGEPLRPQSTPVIAGDRLFTLGFTGILQARDSATGKLLWAVDLVSTEGATPVQFGFSASPIVDDGKLIVAVGGKHAIIAFDPEKGIVLWRSEAAEPAYATPVVQTWENQKFIVQLTRDTLLGLDPATGKTRWSYTLPTKGFTNVPTPLVLSGGRILVSGQGCGGTRLLQLEAQGETIQVKELWFQRKAQYFYTNWVTDEIIAVGFSGNTGKRLIALRVKDGAVLSQDVGYTDANLVLCGKELLTLRRDGVLTLGIPNADGFEVTRAAKPFVGRFWAPPTILGDSIIIRSSTEIARVKQARLKADFAPPADSGVSALDEAYGPKAMKK